MGMKRLCSVVFSLVLSSVAAQQEASFSHYMFNHQAINAAYVGARNTANFTSVLRSQWAGIEGAPLTQTLSYNTALNESQLGYGFNIVNDKIGPISSTSFDVDAAYHLTINQQGHRLALGLKFSVMNYFLDTSKIMTSQPNDAAFFLDTDRTILTNIGFGAYYYTPSFYLGFAVPRMLAHADFRLEPHYYLMGGGLLRFSERFMLKPSLLLKQVNRIAGYDLTVMAIYNSRVWGGFQLRNNFNRTTFQTFAGTRSSVLLGIHLGRSISLGYAYGIPAALSIPGFNGSTHEVFLRYDIVKVIQGYLRSPRFF